MRFQLVLFVPFTFMERGGGGGGYLRLGRSLRGHEELHLTVFSSGNRQRDVGLQVEVFLTPYVDLT